MPASTSTYQSPTGETRAQVTLRWATPRNVDGSAITDGDRFEISWRTTATAQTVTTWGDLAGRTWASLGTWQQPVTPAPEAWHHDGAGFDQTEFTLEDLTPGVPYELRIRAVDGAKPPNRSSWSTPLLVTAAQDRRRPATPAAAQLFTAAGWLRVVHALGVVTGGEYGLDTDLDHLEVHATTGTPDAATLVGRMSATAGMLAAHLPAVLLLPAGVLTAARVVAVDRSGNRSLPSPVATV